MRGAWQATNIVKFRRDKTATALNSPTSPLQSSETQHRPPCLLQICQRDREVVLASVGNRHTFLIPQLTKEPLPGFAGRSSTMPSRYSESSSIRMWWGLSRGLSSPRTQSKEVLGGNHSCRCSPAPSLSGPALKWGKVLAVPHPVSQSSGRRETTAPYLQTADPRALEKRISSSTWHQRKMKCEKVFLWNLDLNSSPVLIQRR